MAISFFNIKTGEQITLDDQHQIGAYLNSSDLHVNSNLGQDFGWRLDADIVIRMDEMRTNPQKLDEISRRTGVAVDSLTTAHLVNQISFEDGLKESAAAVKTEREPEFKKQYEEKIAALKGGNEKPIVKSAKK